MAKTATVTTLDLGYSFSREDLQAAFNKVADPADWRAPIRCRIPMADLRVTRQAVDFFTATTLHIDEHFTKYGASAEVLVYARGCRAGDAGDH